MAIATDLVMSRSRPHLLIIFILSEDFDAARSAYNPSLSVTLVEGQDGKISPSSLDQSSVQSADFWESLIR